MYGTVEVLSDLKLLSIQRRFGNEYIDVRNISLRSARPMTPGASVSVPVTYVENCTCFAANNVAGIYDIVTLYL